MKSKTHKNQLARSHVSIPIIKCAPCSYQVGVDNATCSVAVSGFFSIRMAKGDVYILRDFAE